MGLLEAISPRFGSIRGMGEGDGSAAGAGGGTTAGAGAGVTAAEASAVAVEATGADDAVVPAAVICSISFFCCASRLLNCSICFCCSSSWAFNLASSVALAGGPSCAWHTVRRLNANIESTNPARSDAFISVLPDF
jgi:hypothetical protein